MALHLPDRPPSSAPASELKIRITGGSGQGRTRLAAFDGALRAAGVADYNLIQLSSVIPPGAVVAEAAPADQLQGGFGDALYCVYAAGWVTTPGSEVWAGIAWSRRQDGSGAGLFVEHTGPSEDDVRHQLSWSLEDMDDGREGLFAYEGDVLSSTRCTTRPACAVVVATYRSVGWGSA